MATVNPINELVLIKAKESPYNRPCPEKGAPGQGSDSVCAQLRTENSQLPPVGSTLTEDPLGIPPHEAQIALQQDVVKELVNKVAWTLGSVYRVSYSNMRTPAREYAWRIVKRILEDNGYPRKISK